MTENQAVILINGILIKRSPPSLSTGQDFSFFYYSFSTTLKNTNLFDWHAFTMRETGKIVCANCNDVCMQRILVIFAFYYENLWNSFLIICVSLEAILWI